MHIDRYRCFIIPRSQLKILLLMVITLDALGRLALDHPQDGSSARPIYPDLSITMVRGLVAGRGADRLPRRSLPAPQPDESGRAARAAGRGHELLIPLRIASHNWLLFLHLV